MRPVLGDRIQPYVRSQHHLYHSMNNVRHTSSRVAEPASDRMQPAAFTSGHLTGCIRSP
jgi:hypothetical protein